MTQLIHQIYDRFEDRTKVACTIVPSIQNALHEMEISIAIRLEIPGDRLPPYPKRLLWSANSGDGPRLFLFVINSGSQRFKKKQQAILLLDAGTRVELPCIQYNKNVPSADGVSLETIVYRLAPATLLGWAKAEQSEARVGGVEMAFNGEGMARVSEFWRHVAAF